MKKIIFTLVFLYVVVSGTFGAEITKSRLIGLDNYVPPFIGNTPQPTTPNTIRVESRYIRATTTDPNYGMFCELSESGKSYELDTYLEFVLASYYSPALVQIRPDAAKAILPADNPRLAGLILGANTYRDLVELSFLDPANTLAISRYKTMLKFIQDRNGIKEEEIKQYYCDSLRGFIAGVITEEFNSISFSVENRSSTHTAVLTRNPQTGQYTLSYGGAYTNNETRVIKDMPTITALLAEMGRRSQDFDQTGINQVSAQAALIPARVLSDAALAEITDIVTRFYIEPNQSTYTAVLEAYKVIDQALLTTRNIKYTHVSSRYQRLLSVLNRDFAQRVFADTRTLGSITILTAEQQRRLVGLR